MESVSADLTSVYGLASLFPSGSRAFKQLQLQNATRVPQEKPDVGQIVSISIRVEITRTHIMPAVTGQSVEGQVLTGKKLVVEGKIHQKLEYIADLAVQPIHAVHFLTPFSSFIVIGKDMDCYSEFDVTGYVEDVYVKLLDKRRIFKNVLLLLNAVPATQI